MNRRDRQVLPLKEQYTIKDGFLEKRLQEILPRLMLQENIDMWIVLAREYNEDPVFPTLVPSLMKTAARLSCLVFCVNGKNELECLSVCRPNPELERIYSRVWDASSETQLQCLSRLIKEHQPDRIVINISDTFALADGLTKALYDELIMELGPKTAAKLVSAEKLCIGWLEKRSAAELAVYPSVYDVALDIIDEAFSKKVITAGVTTTSDVEWWIMQQINDLGLDAWFAPTVDLQRQGVEDKRISDAVILPGDILHCDVGLTYLGLCTDTQRVVYVLKPGEEQAPEGLKSALKLCNLFQDIVTNSFETGKTGNEILSISLEKARERDIKAMLYSHPIGFHGHGAGPLMGLWNDQSSRPAKGDYALNENTCYALELNTSSPVAEWGGQEVTIFLEETIAYTESGCCYLRDRQTEFIVI